MLLGENITEEHRDLLEANYQRVVITLKKGVKHENQNL
ncbi:hypothetical protein CWATWH0401_2773 [Crocosphaera watsonii WH 0401]|uniref:Uncharacterized protein n=1 Tax=Crocosphaera watsonii WH 0401 TaxID=555881 RepID=T2J6F6_CROWT|nr:hypothetical protein CWATWH0401_2773 [Crocosphaera watsonii WH 0401]